MKGDMFPKTALDALKLWDEGHPVFTVEMGGLGPGYEQAIQIGVFELIRAFGGVAPTFKDDAELNDKMNKVIWATPQLDGISGAMAGAMKNLSYRTMKDGWRATLLTVDDGRIIQVTKNFPSG